MNQSAAYANVANLQWRSAANEYSTSRSRQRTNLPIIVSYSLENPLRSKTSNPKIDLYSTVELVIDVREGGYNFKKGTNGIVIFCYSDNEGYEIEIEEGHHAVLTVTRQMIQIVRGKGGEANRNSNHRR